MVLRIGDSTVVTSKVKNRYEGLLRPVCLGKLKMNCGLTLSAGNHQSGSDHNQKDTHGGRDFLVIVRGNADMRVAEADAVMFRMGEGNEKGKHAQHQ